jgi:predicted CoA-substrate-specific enzyme activase
MSKAGLDIGSLYIGGVVIEGDKIADSVYLEHRGDLAGALNTLLQRPAFRSFDTIGVCGNFLNMGRGVIDSSLASIEGIKFLAPGCRNVFTIGGETFSLIVFDEKGEYREHSINPPCAAGTGAFIEQQAKRLNLTVPELADHALAYTGKTPLIATRCAVFAKTDITHAMQEGYSLDAVCAGLCEGIARNVLDTLVKGREIHPPAAVTGGVSLNKKIVNAISNILKINVNVPEHSHVAGAVGAAALGTRSKLDLNSILPGDRFRKNIRLPLKLTLADYPDFSLHKIFNIGDVEVLIPQGGPNDSESLANSLKGGAFLGIDIGSTSTKAVLINGTGEAKGGFYTPTGGDPINSVRKLIKTIKSLIAGQNIEIRGSCTTGSGRKMIKTLFNADMEINEITAHAKAAVHLNPGVDTVIEIGGQDSKFTRIRDGEVYFSNMNYVCAAGTGSFIEEQAKRLGVSLEDFSELALGARAPYTSDRCTVYV